MPYDNNIKAKKSAAQRIRKYAKGKMSDQLKDEKNDNWRKRNPSVQKMPNGPEGMSVNIDGKDVTLHPKQDESAQDAIDRYIKDKKDKGGVSLRRLYKLHNKE